MRINNIKNYPCFKGYHSIIADASGGNLLNIMHISAVLNNENSSDLAQFQELMKSHPVPLDNTENLLSLTYFDRFDGNCGVFLNDSRIILGDELLFLRNKYKNGEIRKDFFKNEERFSLKAHTFLAALTKKIMNCNKPIDYNMAEQVNLVLNAIANLKSAIGTDEMTSFQYMNMAIRKNLPFQEIAGIFNRLLQKSMEHYL